MSARPLPQPHLSSHFTGGESEGESSQGTWARSERAQWTNSPGFLWRSRDSLVGSCQPQDLKQTSTTGPNSPTGGIEGRSWICGNRGGRAYTQVEGKFICQTLWLGAGAVGSTKCPQWPRGQDHFLGLLSLEWDRPGEKLASRGGESCHHQGALPPQSVLILDPLHGGCGQTGLSRVLMLLTSLGLQDQPPCLWCYFRAGEKKVN